MDQTDAQFGKFLSSYLFRIDGWNGTAKHRKQLVVGDASLCHVEGMKTVSSAETLSLDHRGYQKCKVKLHKHPLLKL